MLFGEYVGETEESLERKKIYATQIKHIVLSRNPDHSSGGEYSNHPKNRRLREFHEPAANTFLNSPVDMHCSLLFNWALVFSKQNAA